VGMKYRHFAAENRSVRARSGGRSIIAGRRLVRAGHHHPRQEIVTC
jgi:hypothetical protein